METITFTFAGHKKIVYESSLTEGRIMVNYLSGIKEENLPNLLHLCEIYHTCHEVPSFLIGAYRAKGYDIASFAKDCGTYSMEVVPELVFQVVNKQESVSWERIK